MRFIPLCFFVCFSLCLNAIVYPIQFSISETKMVKEIPGKKRDFAQVVPGFLSTYIYSEESDYYQNYQESYFAYTCKKGGWDCLRHYEILANGCIPYFWNLEDCDPQTMELLPKALILEAMHLPGVTAFGIDHEEFDEKRYREILSQLLEYTRAHLTTRAMASYFLQSIGYKGSGKILFLLKEDTPDYMPICLLIGLKELLGDRVVDLVKIPYIYTNYEGDIKLLYGKGMSYTKILEDLPIDRENIINRIQNREFDLVIYGSVHRGLPYQNLISYYYGDDEIVYVCGNDMHKCCYKNLPHLFLREFEAIR